MEMLLGILTALGVNQTIWIQLGLFVSVLGFLTFYVFRPYLKAAEERQSKTVGNQDAAEKIHSQTRELEAQYQRKARNLSADIKSIYDKARAEATREQDRILAAAREQAKSGLERTREKIQEEFNKAREALIKEAPAIGEAINSRLLDKELQ